MSYRKMEKVILAHENIIVTSLLLILFRLPSFFEPYWNYRENHLFLSSKSFSYLKMFEGYLQAPLSYLIYHLSPNLSFLRFISFIACLISLISFRRILLLLTENRLVINTALLLWLIVLSTPLFAANVASSLLFSLPWVLLAIQQYMYTLRRGTAFLSKSWYLYLFFSLIAVGIDLSVLPILLVPIFHIMLFAPSRYSTFRTRNLATISLLLGIGCFLLIVYTFRLSIISGISQFESSIIFHPWLSKLEVNFIGQAWFSLIMYVVGIWVAVVLGNRESKQNAFLLLWLTMSMGNSLLTPRRFAFDFLVMLAPLILIFAKLMSTRQVTKSFKRMVVGIGFVLITFSWFTTQTLLRTVSYYQNFGLLLTKEKSTEAFHAWFGYQVPQAYTIAQWLQNNIKESESYMIWGDLAAVDLLLKKPRSPVIYDENGIIQLSTDQIPRYILIDPGANDKQIIYNYLLAKRYVQIIKVHGVKIYKFISP